jgi:hypothetical protein
MLRYSHLLQRDWHTLERSQGKWDDFVAIVLNLSLNLGVLVDRME